MRSTIRLTNGDLHGMDAGELRDHAARFAAEHADEIARPFQPTPNSDYLMCIAIRIADLTGIDPSEVLDTILDDSNGIEP